MIDFQRKERTALEFVREQLATAERPIVLFSGGKDSLVLVHLCLRFKKVPVMFFRFPKFPEKNRHALSVIERWDLESYDMWPTTTDEYQHGEYFEVMNGYTTGLAGRIYLATGVRKREDDEPRFLCAVEDLIDRPKTLYQAYPWDVTFHGQKGCDDPHLGQRADITQPVSRLGNTRLVLPFMDWTDADIWTYIKFHSLPYDKARYDEGNEATSPDKYPTCYRCLDTQLDGQQVLCPKYQVPIQNIAKSPEQHAAFREQIVGSLEYCRVSGEPRSTEAAHI